MYVYIYICRDKHLYTQKEAVPSAKRLSAEAVQEASLLLPQVTMSLHQASHTGLSFSETGAETAAIYRYPHVSVYDIYVYVCIYLYIRI